MMEFLISLTDALDKVSVWISIVSFVVIVASWFELRFGRGKREKEFRDRARSHKGKISSALIVDALSGSDVTKQVIHFMAEHESLKHIPDERIRTVSRDRHITPEDMPSLAKDIQNAMAELGKLGTDEINVFIAGPGCVAALVGAELANKYKVHLFQRDSASHVYIDFGEVKYPRF